MVDDATPRPGLTVGGRWRLLKQLAEGHTGRVFQARDTVTGDRVAVKLLHFPLSSVHEAVRRFAREFEVTSRIDHPNVVRAIAFGQEDSGALEGTHWLVLELVEGRRLSEVLASGPVGVDRAARIALEVARALQAAHAHGVVHRDIEPSNVVLSRSKGKDVAKVLDFGVARVFQGDESLTGFGVRLGTAEYMSPEYIEAGELDERSDLYALGVLLYALLTGLPPFVGPALKVMQEHVTAPVPPPSSRTAGLPPWLDDLVVRLLAKNPAQRPANANEIVALLELKMPEVAEEVSQERRASAEFASLPPTDPPMPASLAHRGGENLPPAYPDPKPLPKVPIAIALVLGAFAVLGVSGLFGIVALLLVL